MTGSITTNAIDAGAEGAPAGWQELRRNPDIQFEPISVPPPQADSPNWFERILITVFDALGSLLSPVGRALGVSWPVLQWVLLGAVVLLAAVLAWRLIAPRLRSGRDLSHTDREPSEWQPEREHSLALLEDADALAAQGRYGEAARLLLTRSVGHIAAARPDWVEPSSTARELAALRHLSGPARSAFATIADSVEKSLFALRTLDRSEWEMSRAAYASFALARIEGGERSGMSS